MTSATDLRPARPRGVTPATDPFDVPSGTTLRFATSITLVVTTTLYVFASYAELRPVGTSGTSLQDARCQVQANLYFTAGFVDLDDSKWQRYHDCALPWVLPYLGWLLGGLFLLFTVAVVLYSVQPAWRIPDPPLTPGAPRCRAPA